MGPIGWKEKEICLKSLFYYWIAKVMIYEL